MNRFSDIIKETTLFSSQSVLQQNMLIHKAWDDLKGINPEIKKHVKISKIQQDTLYLTTGNGVWAQEIQLITNSILASLNKALKAKTPYQLKHITIFVGNQ